MKENSHLRLGILGIVVVSLFAGLFARLYFLQVMTAPEFQQAAEANRIRVVQEQAPRGRILDRDGKVIVDNRVSIVVAVDRATFNELDDREAEELLARLSDELTRAGDPVTVDELRERIDDKRFSPYTPVPVAQDMPEELKILIEEHAQDYPSVVVERTAVRRYPYGGVAAHVLGYVGEINDVELEERVEVADKPYLQGDDIGKSGIERVYESDLRGVPGVKKIEVDAEGDPIRVVEQRDPVPGDDVVLSIDIDVQAVAEQALAEGLEAARNRRAVRGNPQNQSPAGSVVIEDPNNGEIVAMASYPTYDPANFVNGISTSQWELLNDPENHFPLNNWAIQGQYAPGSTFKLVTAYAAARTGLRSPGAVYHDTGTYRVPQCRGAAGCVFRNAGSRAYGNVDLPEAITVSSDAYFYDLGAQFWIQQDVYGQEAIQTAARDFGLGAKSGIPLASEQAGRIPTPDWRRDYCEDVGCDPNWYTGTSVNMAIGQGEVAVTPLQLTNAYSTFANGGTLYSPNVVLEVRKAKSDQVLRRIEPRVTAEVPLPAEIRDPILQGLVGVTTNPRGTADHVFADFPNDTWPVAAKTGTAEVDGKADTSLFTAFGPAYDPQYVVTAVMEESGFGSSSAAPVVRRILDVLAGVVPEPELQPGGELPPPAPLVEASGEEALD